MNQQEDTGKHVDPRWARAYDELNHHVMKNNEWGLARPPKTVDFEKMGEMGNNLAGFFGGLAKALDVFQVTTEAAAFVILPYNDRSSSSGQKMGAIYYWRDDIESAKRIEDKFEDDEDTLSSAFGRISELAPGSEVRTVGLGYFVKAVDAPVCKSQFNVDEAVSFNQIAISNAGDAVAWMDTFPQSDFVQRFVFLLRYYLKPGEEDILLHNRTRLMHLFGGSLSTIGVAGEEVNNQLAIELGMNLGIKAHQVGNALYGLSKTLASMIDKLSDQENDNLRADLVRLKEEARAVQLTARRFEEIGTSAQEVPWTYWHPIFENKVSQIEPSYDIEWDTTGILQSTQSTKIRFIGEFLGILIANLVENAHREHVECKNPQRLIIRVSSYHDNGELVLRIANSGPPISDGILLKLFRAPVKGTGNNGRGLWMLGMAFTNAGSPLPTVYNEDTFGPVFELRFRAQQQKT